MLFDSSLRYLRLGVKTKEWSQAQRNIAINLFKQGKKFRLMQKRLELY